jgi:hypothetical protein
VRPPSHRYRKKARYRTATDYGPGICIRARIPYRTVHAAFEFFFGTLVKKLLGGRIRVQYSDPDLPGLIRSHPGIAFAGRAMPAMKGIVQEDDYRTKVRF